MAYSLEQIDQKFNQVIEKIEQGVALRNALRELHISSNTFTSWVNSDEHRRLQYACACEARADKLFEEIIEIADDSSGDVKRDKDGNEYLNQEFVQRSRVRIDARKWMLGKLMPKKYGDSIKLTGDEDNPIQTKLTINIIKTDAPIASDENEIE